MTNTSKTILLVEDDSLIALSEQLIIQSNGFNVITASNGEEAIKLFKENNIDLILMDIDLGNCKDGTVIAKEILNSFDIPIVFLSSHTEPEVVAKTEGITSYGYIDKGSGETVLIASIRMAFKLFEAKQEIKSKQEHLRISEERLRLAFESTQLGAYDFDIKNNQILVNSEYAKMLGYDPYSFEETYTDFINRIHPDDKLFINQKFQDFINNRSDDYNVQFRVINSSGNYIWIKSLGRIVERDGNGVTLRVVGTHTDITESVNREQNLLNRILSLTNPASETTDISYNNLFDLEIIQVIQDHISEIFGVTSIITLPDGSPITRISNANPICEGILQKNSNGIRNCFRGDRLFVEGKNTGFVVLRCSSCGLLDGGIPIFVGDVHLANWMVGQVRDENANESTIRSFAKENELDENHLVNLFNNSTFMSKESLERLGKLISVVTSLLAEIAMSNIKQARYINSLKIAEDSLRKSNYYFREISRISRIGSWDKDLILGTDEWSDLTKEIHEVPTDFVPNMEIGVNFYKEGESREKIIAAVTNTIKTGEPFDEELEIITAKGNTKWVRAIGKPEFKDGRCIRLYGTFQDIHEQKIKQLEIIENERKFRTLYETMNQGVIYQDSEGKIISCNPAAERILGFSANELLNNRIDPSILITLREDGSEFPFTEHPLTLSMTIGKPYSNVIIGIKKSNSEDSVKWLSIDTVPIYFTNDTNPDRVYALFSDITEQKNAQDQIKLLLTQKEVLLREVHHRIKNNMSVIESMLFLQTREYKDPVLQNAVKDTQRRITNMRLLYEKLLASPDFKNLSIKSYLEDIINSLKSIYPQLAIIDLIISIDDFKVNSKISFPIGMIINELVTNSIKYAFTSFDTAEVGIELTKDNGSIRLLVRDNGIGFPENFSFDKGQGFGCKLVSLLSQQLNGTISFANNNGAEVNIVFNP